MEEEETGMQDSKDTAGAADTRPAEVRRGPGWKAWVLSVVVAVILSVTATLLLGGSGAFRLDRAGTGGSGSGCCPPEATGK